LGGIFRNFDGVTEPWKPEAELEKAFGEISGLTKLFSGVRLVGEAQK